LSHAKVIHLFSPLSFLPLLRKNQRQIPYPRNCQQNVQHKDYGAKGDNITLDTQSIQSALNACALAGGGTILFPAPGIFVTQTLHILSSN
jgi:polygalacturonase